MRQITTGKRELSRPLGKAFLVILLLLCTAGLTSASQAGYTLDWWTASGGGGTLSDGGGYTLGGTAGQPGAGDSSGGDYALTGGFWGSIGGDYFVYLPLVLR